MRSRRRRSRGRDHAPTGEPLRPPRNCAAQRHRRAGGCGAGLRPAISRSCTTAISQQRAVPPRDDCRARANRVREPRPRCDRGARTTGGRGMTRLCTGPVGLAVVHPFCKPTRRFDIERSWTQVRKAEASGCRSSPWRCSATPPMRVHGAPRRLRAACATDRAATGRLDVVDSYVSMTDVSEYASGVPDEMLRGRLYPMPPPE